MGAVHVLCVLGFIVTLHFLKQIVEMEKKFKESKEKAISQVICQELATKFRYVFSLSISYYRTDWG